MKIPANFSWYWRKLLQLRHFAQSWIKSDIGDGKSNFFWFDNWHALGLLYLRYLGLSIASKVSDLVKDGRWSWPKGRRFNVITQEF